MSLKILLQTILRLAREQAQHKILEKKERKRETSFNTLESKKSISHHSSILLIINERYPAISIYT